MQKEEEGEKGRACSYLNPQCQVIDVCVADAVDRRSHTSGTEAFPFALKSARHSLPSQNSGVTQPAYRGLHKFCYNRSATIEEKQCKPMIYKSR